MEQVYILMFWAPLLLCCVAEQQYFPQPNASTWEQSRHHCQVCYEELVTLTPNNIQIIVRNLSSSYWIGLRKRLDAPTAANCAMPWSCWANGDPLTFQNWYPGRPMVNRSDICPRCDCCCPSGCGDVGLTAFTAAETTTVETTTASSTTQAVGVTVPLDETDDARCEEDVYIEDPCVAMVSFGAWFERNCSRHLPYICYEDRFYANATVTNVTINSGTLHWLRGPGDISRYRVEVRKATENVKDDNLTQTLSANDFTCDLVDLTAGTLYLVQVFPVKCERDLNAENVTFYTKPEVVTNLMVAGVTESSIRLLWSPPRGNRDSYYIKVKDEPNLSTTSVTEEAEFKGLIPGSCYTFDVIAVAGTKERSEEGVRSTEGEPVSAAAYSKPSTVSDLNVSDSLRDSLRVRWKPPKGNYTGYRVTAYDNHTVNSSYYVYPNRTWQKVTGLPAGTKVLLSVVALANVSLEGTPVTEFGYTAPNPVEDLKVSATGNSLNVSWNPPQGNYESFTVVLIGQEGVDEVKDVLRTHHLFSFLKYAANYTVTVHTVNRHLKSESRTSSNFTMPTKPRNPTVEISNKTNITLRWDPPYDTLNATYRVTYRAVFWGEEINLSTKNNIYMFEGLRTGTTYDFEVRTVAGPLESEPITASQPTDPEEGVLSLALQCSTTRPLDCERGDIPDKILDKLREYFTNRLTTKVFWKLNWRQE